MTGTIRQLQLQCQVSGARHHVGMERHTPVSRDLCSVTPQQVLKKNGLINSTAVDGLARNIKCSSLHAIQTGTEQCYLLQGKPTCPCAPNYRLLLLYSSDPFC